MIRFYTRKETAGILRVSVHTVDRYSREGKLIVRHLGGDGHPRFYEDDILEFMGIKRETPEEKPEPVDDGMPTRAEINAVLAHCKKKREEHCRKRKLTA